MARSEELATVGSPILAFISLNRYLTNTLFHFYQFLRTARLSFYGGALFGPAMTTWYSFLNRIEFPSPTKALVYRVWLDQAILTPVPVAFFYGSMSILEGKPEEATSRIKAASVPTIIRNWCVLTDPQWRLLILFRGVYIPTQLINFSIVPPHLRFFTVSVVSWFWSKRLMFCHLTGDS
ncbi:uncharacterized protein LACBIDRAFT_308281 [Laccaria bicolor S238N-H82]|uniref:Predicted protein n=1 Tax=Laccaria bicolor (strain S238N-H82 / ATCC MYA-4686) TaxID=486041 RepID=B0DS00_LACBS|nr:uncharacterized protein LACBIDRAFT_308281 [Laccaria bicolor S238N-H82]EDR02616.1 predicted protein [Laccaria bicolor S238N-H82]|eukprot:XP_001886660.1 predicted protein [Laccaria bicolor S238N-H82]